MRVQRPVFTDFAFQAELLAVSWQQQFDGGGVKADAVVKRLHVVLGVDAFNRHHRHQDVLLLNQARVAGKQRFDKERFVRHYYVVNPRTRNIHTRQIAFVVHQFVNLGDNNAIVEGCRFDQRWRVFGAGTGIQVAFAVSFKASNQRDVRRKIDI
ncbi:hypothetical protein D3C75_586490 [compost metagenome]